MTNWLSRKAKEQDEVYFLTNVSSDVVEDNFEQGEIGQWQSSINEKENKRFNSIEELLEYLYKNYGLSTTKSDYAIVDDGNISTSILQNEDGISVDEGETLYKQWKEGKARLWNAYFTIRIEIIKANKISADELHTLGFSE